MDVNAALHSQLHNICARTGQTLESYSEVKAKSGLVKHGEIREMFKSEHGLSHGDANTLTHFVLGNHGGALAAGKSDDEIVAEIYAGPKAELYPVHQLIIAALEGMGEYEVSPKKGYLSLKRRRQFATLGPATNTRVELGLNLKGVEGTEVLLAQPAGSMCQFKVKLMKVEDVTEAVVGWLKMAFEASG